MYKSISQEDAKRIMDSEQDYLIVDVRQPEEYEDGHIPYSILLPLPEVLEKAEKVLPDKRKLLLVYCRSGNRSKKACMRLDQLGYEHVLEFGGITTWKYVIEK